jgi:diadenosine tetraphosphatase ApaH/serine/threonine PP2A family protein phosphatase
VLVIHGGLFGRPGVTLDDLNAIDRLDYSPAPPPEDEPTTVAEARAQDLRQLMRDALWSDPKDSPGSEFNSVRRQGQLFGPDVTAEFLDTNGMLMVVRSHEWCVAPSKAHLTNCSLTSFLPCSCSAPDPVFSVLPFLYLPGLNSS